ncbi:glycosyltransferase family protein [Cytophagaceae bacterium DM2B3-1]|uniref:Glycosyltransferase family protein n=1 Tax=Xanthocytophaga flava TaxID=3048013 RepID=A0ABT7CDC2_9BACT|nr:glycosyltransferase family protein [Xanthocytophaga flavus]MDJ1491719.1 glycosyltransferase family protein [Xanthocytophaga flavus]
MNVKSKKIGIITQARMTSTRLPGKILKHVGGKTILEYHLDRLQWSNLPIYIATTTNATDDEVSNWALEHKIPCYRGSENDVLTRYYSCALENRLDVIVRVTSDCPLIDGKIIRQAVNQYITNNDSNEYLSNCLVRTFPRGFDFEIFSFELLEEAHQHATTPTQREHVTPYINQNVSGKVHIKHITRTSDNSQYRITLDTEDDFKLIRKLIEDFNCETMETQEIISLLMANPWLHEINSHIEQKKI